MPLTILIIDDHALFRSALATMLAQALADVAVIESDTLDAAVGDAAPAIVLLDVRLRGADGLEGIDRLRARWPAARIVVVSGVERDDIAAEALHRGATAFFSKTDRPEGMLIALRRLLDDARPVQAGADPRPLLTPRQREVLDLLSQGLSNKAIGRRLGVSEHTVRGHVQATLLALDASSRAEAAFAARRLGLVR